MWDQVYVGAIFRAFLGHVGSCWWSWALCWLILALFGPILPPSCRKMAPKWPNIDQHSAKMGQNCSPRAPKSSKNLEKPIKTWGFWRFLAIWLFASKIPKSGQDASQNGLKLVSLGSKMAILGPSWRQVGQLSAILAPTWPILVPRWAPRGTFFTPFSEFFGGIAPNPQKATQIAWKCSQNGPKNAPKMVKKCSEICSRMVPPLARHVSKTNPKTVHLCVYMCVCVCVSVCLSAPACVSLFCLPLFWFFLAFPMLEQVIKFRASRSYAKQVHVGSFFVLFRSLGALGSHLGALGPHLVAKLAQDGAKMTQHSST